ncbi:IS3 family transposase [Aquicoccus sp. SU-CL01552]|uniref:IS3 family transposase n=1 Tax=Aquicoccus sp. SU-CL01552 TaxID=3127656 RepID=UPI003102DE87
MIEPAAPPELSIGQQCKLLSIARSSFYDTPKGETERNLDLMRRIDEQFLETPFFGVRQMTWHLRNDGHFVNGKRIRRLMRLMRKSPRYCAGFQTRCASRRKTTTSKCSGSRVGQLYAHALRYRPRMQLGRSDP